MKKFLALLLTLTLMGTLVACGGQTAGEVSQEAEASVSQSAETTANYTEEQMDALIEVYTECTNMYNALIAKAQETGWLADELTLTEMTAVEGMLGYIGNGLTEDLTVFDAVEDFDQLIETVAALVPELEGMMTRVSVAYVAPTAAE